MTTALIYTALLATLTLIIWLAARKAGRAEKELEYAKRANKKQQAAGEILGRYVNMSSLELSERVREKRAAAKQRLRDQNRLDG